MEKPWLKYVAEGTPNEIEIPEVSLTHIFEESVRKFSDYTAITFSGNTYTYRHLNQLIRNVAGSLRNLGVNKGDSVALMLPNCPQYPISYFAVLMCGATVVQVNPMYKSSELLHVLNDSGARVMIALNKLLPGVKEVMNDTEVEALIPVSIESDCKFDEYMRTQEYRVPEVSINPKEDIAVLQYTGGTTGRSKGAMLTHYNLVANTLQSYATSQVRTRIGEERVLSISPLFHVYGMTSCMNLTFYIGGNLILTPKFDVEQTVEIIENTKPTIFPGVPTMFIALLNYYKEKQFDLTSLRTCTSGSAPLPVEVLNKFNETSGTNVAEGFGLSEASPVTHRNPITGLQKPGSIGIPIPNTDAKIVDSASGVEELEIGEVGELVIKGPQIMKGYWNMPEETDNVLRDGWLFTGDLAKMDADGFFYIVGRKKEMIIASGYNVYPVEVEDVIYTHPNVLEAAVIGVPDKYRGETIKAVIVPKDGKNFDGEQLIAYCRKRLAAYKVPQSVEIVRELPKTTVGKILKRSLIETYS
ncbi:long-chain acyl-CoA synthetase [Lentibacillus halodurans]|uniref:Long-chain acyl-CoA synthetase n=1 Tax=Lentibacillus halodurans TaxID=237679 RepID=A0A1I0ZA95_9BACI|nr:long-chain fatty acid--CoA ligase [Lentibacillus halodurans]SFB22451.1 long-chain acyl-CoA synthetase [Lentibacillus halodurans]